MKTLKILSMIVFALCLVSTVSAIGVYGDWEDGNPDTLLQDISITIGDSVGFNADFISINPPMTINVKLYDSTSNLVYSFENSLSVSDTYYFPSYTIDQSAYSVSGDYELIISGSDTVNSDSHSLYLTVNEIQDTNIPVITLLGDAEVNIIVGDSYTDMM